VTQTGNAARSGSISKPDADITDLTVPGGPHGDVAVRIVRPVGTSGPLPVVLFIHGPGWVFGDTITHDKLRTAGVAVTAQRYPGAIHDFVMVDAMADSNAAKDATAQAIHFLTNAISNKPPSANGEPT
jgi:acetyl esterase/lipase